MFLMCVAKSDWLSVPSRRSPYSDAICIYAKRKEVRTRRHFVSLDAGKKLAT